MGNSFNVAFWKWDEKTQTGKYIFAYEGESFFKAMYYLFKLKIQKEPCIKLVWR